MPHYQKIKQLVEDNYQEMIEMREHLHRNPEVSYKEFETTKFIKSRLDELGIPYESPLETGCVGIIQGDIKSDKVIALRADIDALAMDEEGDFKKDFFSTNKGAAHCCGHDAHTANLLGTAKILMELKSEIKGKILLIFQPGEEKLPGGGRLLCETGFLQKQKVDAIFGLHTAPNYPPGKVVTKVGPFMASPDEFELEIIGNGGHAARPHDTVDPVVLASQFVTMAQSIVSRAVNPTKPAVITIGRIEGGTAHNIIPEKVKLWGTVRTFDKEVKELIKAKLDSLAKGITESVGGSYSFNFNYGYPAVINSENEANLIIKNSRNLFGEESVIDNDSPIMAGEDFAFYQEIFPGSFCYVGSGSEDSDSTYMWHHPKYNVDNRFFLTAAPLMVSLALNN